NGSTIGTLFRATATGGSSIGRSHLEVSQQPPTGVANPMYDQLGGNGAAFRQHHQGTQPVEHQYPHTSSWGEQRPNTQDACNSRLLGQSLARLDRMGVERQEPSARDLSGEPPQHQDAWEPLPSSLPLHHPTPDLLNNQV
ncbi:unnamed protein product, partial [Meganyctiphanes norvegica]